jgi:hypothetical protein
MPAERTVNSSPLQQGAQNWGSRKMAHFGVTSQVYEPLNLASSREVVMAFLSKPARPWRIVAEEVSREPDGQRMTELVEELLEALEQEKTMQPEPQELQSPHDLSKTA